MIVASISKGEIFSIFLIVFLLGDVITSPSFIKINRKRSRKLTIEEKQMVNEAKQLIKKVYPQIVLANFSVYKTIEPIGGAFFYRGVNSHELCVFVPFKTLIKFFGKNVCFMVLVHEILHSQNLKDGKKFFKKSFLEGLNQLLTIWLIDNYSDSYQVPSKLFNRVLFQRTRMVENVFRKLDLDMKDIFLNYIDMNEEFF